MPQSSSLIRLSDLPHDIPARLVDIRGGRHLTRRLLALGLRQGSEIMIVQRRGQGLILASGVTRIAVGSGIAEKLWVTPHGAVADALDACASPGADNEAARCLGFNKASQAL